MPAIDILRAYDAAVVARFSPATVQVNGQPVYQVTVPGVTNPVPLGMGLPSEWYASFSMPAISITRGVLIPDPKRQVASWVSQTVNQTDTSKWDVQRDSPIPVSIPYTVELIAATMSDMNWLVLYLMTAALPLMGYGTTVTVSGTDYPFEHRGSKDKTSYATKEGRLFVYEYDYVVDGWVYTSTVDSYTRVGEIDLSVETYKDQIAVEATPPPLASTADRVDSVTIT